MINLVGKFLAKCCYEYVNETLTIVFINAKIVFIRTILIGGIMEKNQFNAAWAKCNALYTRAAAVMQIGYPEMMVLYALETMGAQTQKQISENFGMQKQTVHTVVRALSKQGCLRLEAGLTDKREKQVILTESGKEYARKMIEPLRKAEEKIYRTIGKEKMQAMCETLDLFNLLFEREMQGGLGLE